MAQHYSFRVPWHDNGWNGRICKNPSDNTSCMRLKGINQGRVESIETKHSACKMCDLNCIDSIPCIREGACFMSEDPTTITLSHPYSTWSDYHKHLKPMKEVFPPFTYPARPFRWVMRNRKVAEKKYKTVEELGLEKGFDFIPQFEPKMDKKTWVQDGRNQKAIFDCFFRDAIENESLCVFYAKQVPFVEDARRVVIGIGHIQKVAEPKRYDMSRDGMTSYAWENMVSHSIREDMKDGFLLPYYDLMDYAKRHEKFDITTGTVFASEDYFEEFSYAAEHLSYDAIIDVLLQCINAVELYQGIGIKGDWEHVLLWLNTQLSLVWKDRGAFPGMGAVLTAFGIPSGFLVAKEIKDAFDNESDIWECVDRVMSDPSHYLSDMCSKHINYDIRNTWHNLPEERRQYLELISRVSLSLDQAKAIYEKTSRTGYNIDFSDRDIIENPYLLYEKTRNKEENIRISIKKVDLAFFPPKDIADEYPIVEPSVMNSSVDKRRTRALTISELEEAALQGHTLMPMDMMVKKIQKLNIDPKCLITGDMLLGMSDFLTDVIEVKRDVNDEEYYKLERYMRIDKLIESQVNTRFESKNRHVVHVDWTQRVDEECDKFVQNPDADIEILAREEKAAALKILAEARLSVLIGGAGTGKTTVLEILCKEPKINQGGILLLAPTGKARVRMSQGLSGKIKFKAKTIAQYLLENNRYDHVTQTYHLREKIMHNGRQVIKPEKYDGPDTVIVDESSMITEDMMGALLDVIRGAQRIIFVGDEHQLPPIGAGRPFVDIINHLSSLEASGNYPKEYKSLARLEVTNRQLPDRNTKRTRSDVRLARWFGGDSEEKDDDIFAELEMGVDDGRVEYKQWKSKEELEKLLCESIKEATGMTDIDDVDGFNRSIGGEPHRGDAYDGITFFNDSSRKDDKKKSCAGMVENWQVLSPVRNDSHGVLHINHYIHDKYRKEMMDISDRTDKIASRLGSGEIIYGDKVINLVNTSRRSVYPQNDKPYLANGEIGSVISKWGMFKDSIEVEFSSQIGYKYKFEKKDFGDDRSEALELAYALTVHKAQGSQFSTVILVMSDKCFLMSKELLYTALTRQKDKLIILYDEEAYELKKFSSDKYSDIAQRYSDIFELPNIVEIENRYFEENLIHKTMNGDMVRSKSEVIIYNLLLNSGITPLYEEKLYLGNTYKLPDFTISDAASGDKIIWEHLGMLGKPGYRRNWEEKKKLYEKYGYSEEKGNLIVTRDSLDGAIDSEEIQQIIDELGL